MVIVGTFILICVAYYGIHGTLPVKPSTPETTITKPAATEKHNDKVLVASLTNEKIYLYKTKSGALLSVNDKLFEYNNWGKSFDAIEPQIFCADFDDDEQNEIVIKAAEYKNSDGKYVSCVYYLDPTADSLDYSVSYFNRTTWADILDVTLTEEVSQLKLSKKMAQFAINYKSAGISYDKKTGVVAKGYGGYFSALCDDNKNYYTIDGFKKGNGEYSVSADNKIFVDVPITVSYKETSDVQLAGRVHFELIKGDNAKISVAPKSLVFIPNEDYPVSDPTKIETRGWSYTERNSDIIIDEKDKLINWIKYRTAYDPSITTQTISYAPTSTDIRSISELTITESCIKMVAKPNCSFDKSYETGEYSVIINEGTSAQFDISYTAELSKDDKGMEILTINFDKPYPKDQIKTININYGAK